MRALSCLPLFRSRWWPVWLARWLLPCSPVLLGRDLPLCFWSAVPASQPWAWLRLAFLWGPALVAAGAAVFFSRAALPLPEAALANCGRFFAAPDGLRLRRWSCRFGGRVLPSSWRRPVPPWAHRPRPAIRPGPERGSGTTCLAGPRLPDRAGRPASPSSKSSF